MKLFSWSVSWILLRLSFFRDCLTGLKAFQKDRHPGERRIRKTPEPGNNILQQLAAFRSGLFFLFFICTAKEVIHGHVQPAGQLGQR